MTSDPSKHIPVLNEKNYQKWKFRMEALLDELDLLAQTVRDLSELAKPFADAEDDSDSEKQLKLEQEQH